MLSNRVCILQINGIDVTSRTHYDCVKLIKKTGDTLALKVITVNYKSTAAAFHNSANLASTSTTPSGLGGFYQSPLSLINENGTLCRTPQQQSTSQSYYATTTINTTNGGQYDTKSLPSKKKRKCPVCVA